MNTPAKVSNPFSQQIAKPAQSSSLVEVESQRAIQEVQAALIIAKKYPRDPEIALDKILNACTRHTLAEGAIYSYSRGGTDVTGPSIRLAEAVAQLWGNMQFGVRELSQANGESTVEAFAWDVETNTRQVKVFQVPHKRVTKKGTTVLTDPRDIYEMVANQGARRLRACILGVIPGDVIEAAVNQCEVTMVARADTSPEAIKKMVSAFREFGVTEEMISKRIQKRLEAINPAQMAQLKKVYASLRDGMSKPSDWFEFSAARIDESSDLSDELMVPANPAVQSAANETSDPQPESDTDLLGDPVMTESQQIKQGLCSAIDTADTVESLEQIGSEIRDYSDKLSEDDLKSVRAVYALALKGLKKKG